MTKKNKENKATIAVSKRIDIDTIKQIIYCHQLFMQFIFNNTDNITEWTVDDISKGVENDR